METMKQFGKIGHNVLVVVKKDISHTLASKYFREKLKKNPLDNQKVDLNIQNTFSVATLQKTKQ